MVPVAHYSWYYLSIPFVIIATWTLVRICRPVSLTFCWENKHGLHSWLDVVILLKYLLSDHTGSPYCLLPLADIAQIVLSSPNYQKERNSSGLIRWGENLLLPYCLTSWATFLGIKVSMFHYFIPWQEHTIGKGGSYSSSCNFIYSLQWILMKTIILWKNIIEDLRNSDFSTKERVFNHDWYSFSQILKLTFRE